jgi:hypothetical protein
MSEIPKADLSIPEFRDLWKSVLLTVLAEPGQRYEQAIACADLAVRDMLARIPQAPLSEDIRLECVPPTRATFNATGKQRIE